MFAVKIIFLLCLTKTLATPAGYKHKGEGYVMAPPCARGGGGCAGPQPEPMPAQGIEEAGFSSAESGFGGPQSGFQDVSGINTIIFCEFLVKKSNFWRKFHRKNAVW